MKKNNETIAERCLRLRDEAESGCDHESALFYTALTLAASLPLPEDVKESGLILLLNRKLAD